MKDRTRELPSDPAPGSESVNARAHRTSWAQCGGKHSEASAETETWLEQVLDATNMQRAWQRVRRNRGAPGMDGMTIDEFPAFAREHWERISSQLKAGTYCPAPVRRVFIPKPDGSQRPLGVPTVVNAGLECLFFGRFEKSPVLHLLPVHRGFPRLLQNPGGRHGGRPSSPDNQRVPRIWRVGLCPDRFLQGVLQAPRPTGN